MSEIKLFSSGKLKGNTLAETLLVTAILGIVFTLGLGIMISDYYKNQTVVRLKKVYSVIEQAFRLAVVNNSTQTTWDFPYSYSAEGSYLFFAKYLRPNLVLARDCKDSTESGCDYTFKQLDGEKKSLNSTWTRFYLNDGAFIAMQTREKPNYKVIYFYVDINGKKRLNVVGRDIFMFEYWIENEANSDYVGKLLPYGHEYSRKDLISNSNPNNCSDKANGNYCSALIMNDNWQLLNGYPWAHARYVIK